MAGLLIKELIARSDLKRCLVAAPGSLVEQWQDELGAKFSLEFDILSRDMIETSRSGNVFDYSIRARRRDELVPQGFLPSRQVDRIIENLGSNT